MAETYWPRSRLVQGGVYQQAGQGVRSKLGIPPSTLRLKDSSTQDFK